MLLVLGNAGWCWVVLVLTLTLDLMLSLVCALWPLSCWVRGLQRAAHTARPRYTPAILLRGQFLGLQVHNIHSKYSFYENYFIPLPLPLIKVKSKILSETFEYVMKQKYSALDQFHWNNCKV